MSLASRNPSNEKAKALKYNETKGSDKSRRTFIFDIWILRHEFILILFRTERLREWIDRRVNKGNNVPVFIRAILYAQTWILPSRLKAWKYIN